MCAYNPIPAGMLRPVLTILCLLFNIWCFPTLRNYIVSGFLRFEGLTVRSFNVNAGVRLLTLVQITDASLSGLGGQKENKM